MKEKEFIQSYLALKQFFKKESAFISHEQFEKLQNDLLVLESEISKIQFGEVTTKKTTNYTLCLDEISRKLINLPGDYVGLQQGILPKLGLSLKIGRDLENTLMDPENKIHISAYSVEQPGIEKSIILSELEKEKKDLLTFPPANFIALFQRKENFVLRLASFLQELK